MIDAVTLTITDDSGYIGIVNAETYNSFVSEDWQLQQLFDHFVQEMNAGKIILWSTKSEHTWTVTFTDNPSAKKSFREFSGTMKVTRGKIYLTNYEDLTMAAQFPDEKIPSKHNVDLSIDLDNGYYSFLVRQLFDETPAREVAEQIHFEIVVQAGSRQNTEQVDKIFWREK